jgi:hypothetical protein
MARVTCTFTGCNEVRLAKVLCAGHYQQAKRGHELSPLMPRKTRVATISAEGQTTFLGYFSTSGLAAAAYRSAAESIHGEFARV